MRKYEVVRLYLYCRYASPTTPTPQQTTLYCHPIYDAIPPGECPPTPHRNNLPHCCVFVKNGACPPGVHLAYVYVDEAIPHQILLEIEHADNFWGQL